VRVRKLTRIAAATLATALVVTGLTGCETKVGVAAIVAGHRISESDLGGYVTPVGPSPTVLTAAAKAGQGVYPKTQVVQMLVQQRLFERTLAKNGGVPTKGELASLHDRAAATFLGTQLTGKALDDSMRSTQGSYGYAGKYAPALLHTIELEAALVVAISASSLADLTKAINKLHLKVQVNPRYGTWDPATLSLSGPSSSIPDFLKLDGGPSASAAPSAPATN